MIQALIFDMDGTLADSEPLHYDAWKEALQQHGVTSFPFATYNNYVGTSNEHLAADYIESHKLSIDLASLVKEKQAIYLQRIPKMKPMPGVHETLVRFHGRYRLAVASSSHTVELTEIIKTLGLTGYFECIVGGDMVKNKKPDPEIYLHAIHLLGLHAKECVAFEDSEPGITAAKAAGTIGIAIPNPLVTDDDFSKADAIIAQINLADEQLLEKLVQHRLTHGS